MPQLDPKNRVSHGDRAFVNTSARRFISRKEKHRLSEVAVMLAACNNEAEEYTVMWWWEEGLRDYVNMEDLQSHKDLLIHERDRILSEK